MAAQKKRNHIKERIYTLFFTVSRRYCRVVSVYNRELSVKIIHLSLLCFFSVLSAEKWKVRMRNYEADNKYQFFSPRRVHSPRRCCLASEHSAATHSKRKQINCNKKTLSSRVSCLEEGWEKKWNIIVHISPASARLINVWALSCAII